MEETNNQGKKLKADFSFMQGAMIDEPIFFHDLSSGKDISSWHWDFGDNSSSIEQHPIHAYRHEGAYTISLTVSNGFDETSISKQISIVLTNKPVLVKSSNEYFAKGTDSLLQNLKAENKSINAANNWGKLLKSVVLIPAIVITGISIIPKSIELIRTIEIFNVSRNNKVPSRNKIDNELLEKYKNEISSAEDKLINNNNLSSPTKKVVEGDIIERAGIHQKGAGENYYEISNSENEIFSNVNVFFPVIQKLSDSEQRFSNACVFTNGELESISINELKNKTKLYPKVFIRGNLNEGIIEKLNSADVKFVMNFERIDKQKTKSKYVFIAGPEDKTVYSRFKEKYTKVYNSSFVSNKFELHKELRAKKPEEKIIAVFNNTDDKLFGEEIKDLAFDEIFTCNSYTIEDNKFQTNTTDFIYIDELIDAIISSQSHDFEYFDDVVYKISKHYNLNLSKKEKRNTMIAVGCAGVGIPTIVLILKKFN